MTILRYTTRYFAMICHDSYFCPDRSEGDEGANPPASNAATFEDMSIEAQQILFSLKKDLLLGNITGMIILPRVLCTCPH